MMDDIKIYTGYIYKITNTDTNKVYIGQTRRTVQKRFKQHLSGAFKETECSYYTYLARSIRKHGTERFIVETIKEVTATSLSSLCKQLDKEEVYYIALYNSKNKSKGYNSTKGGQLTNLSCDEIEKRRQLKKLHVGCCVPGCNRVHLANGYCQKHYLQIYVKGAVQEKTILDRNEIVIYYDYAEVILYDKLCKETARAKIDLEDVDKVKNIKWSLSKQKRSLYAKASAKNLIMHYFILNKQPDKINNILHKNGDNLDNRKANLVLVDQSTKQQNMKLASNNKSGCKGVWWCKDRNKWQAQIIINNKQKSLGRFNTFEEAVTARKAAEKLYYNII